MSAVPPKADIHQRIEHVRYVPIAEVTACRLILSGSGQE
jgi:hypothetical protein